MKEFVLDDDEVKQIEKWKRTHKCKSKKLTAIGGKETYFFTPTGIGIAVEVLCICGKKLIVRELS